MAEYLPCKMNTRFCERRNQKDSTNPILRLSKLRELRSLRLVWIHRHGWTTPHLRLIRIGRLAIGRIRLCGVRTWLGGILLGVNWCGLCSVRVRSWWLCSNHPRVVCWISLHIENSLACVVFVLGGTRVFLSFVLCSREFKMVNG